jgi:tetratricopeptide (TPR) repeat protein
MYTLADSYQYLGRHTEALKLREETLELRKAKLGPDHPDTLLSMISLAISYERLGRHAEAIKLGEETLALQKVKLGPDHPETLWSMNNLANSYDVLGRHAEAIKLREESLALQKAKLGPDHPNTLLSINNFAWALVTSADRSGHDAAKAVALAEDVIAIAPQEANYWNTLGVARYRAGNFEGAIAALQKYRELRTDDREGSNPFFLAMTYWQLGKKDEARGWFEKGAQWLDKQHAPSAALQGFRSEAAALLGVNEPQSPPDPQLKEK